VVTSIRVQVQEWHGRLDWCCSWALRSWQEALLVRWYVHSLCVSWSCRKLIPCSKTVLVLKYVVPEYPFPTLYFGIANVIANGFIMLRYVTPSLDMDDTDQGLQLGGTLDLTEYGR